MQGTSGPSYSQLTHAVAAISRRLRGNRTNRKVLDQSIAELEGLLGQVRDATKQHELASSRGPEAQLLMHRAVIQHHRNDRLGEATSYLQASQILLDIERERMRLNYPTMDECLARGVLCVAMACHVLLSVRYNPAENPIPRKLQQYAHSPPARCAHYAALQCIRAAAALLRFSCFEAAADYYELASLLVTEERELQSVTPVPRTPGVGADNGSDTASNVSFSFSSPLNSATRLFQQARDNFAASGAPGSSAAFREQQAGRGATPSEASVATAATGLHRQGTAVSLAGESTLSGVQPSVGSNSANTHGGSSAPVGTLLSSRNKGTGGGSSTADSGARKANHADPKSLASGMQEVRRVLVVLHGMFATYRRAAMGQARVSATICDYERTVVVLDHLIGQSMVFLANQTPPELAISLAERREKFQQRLQLNAEVGMAADAEAADIMEMSSRRTDEGPDLPPVPPVVSAEPVAEGGEATSGENAGDVAKAEDGTNAAANPNGEQESSAATTPRPAGEGPQAKPVQRPNPALMMSRPRTEDDHYETLLMVESNLIQARVMRFFATLLIDRLDTKRAVDEVNELRLLAQTYRAHERRRRQEALSAANNVVKLSVSYRKQFEAKSTEVDLRSVMPVSFVRMEPQRTGIRFGLEHEQFGKKAAKPEQKPSETESKDKDENGEKVEESSTPKPHQPASEKSRAMLLGLLGEFAASPTAASAAATASKDTSSNSVEANIADVGFSDQLDELASTLAQFARCYDSYVGSANPAREARTVVLLRQEVDRLMTQLGIGCREVLLLCTRAKDQLSESPFADIAPLKTGLAEMVEKRLAEESKAQTSS